MRKATISSITLLCISCLLNGQVIDQRPRADTNQVIQWHKESFDYLWKSVRNPYQKDIFLDSAIFILKNALALSESLRQQKFITESQRRLANVYFRRDNIAEGKKWICKAIDNYHAEGKTEKEGDALFGIASNIFSTAPQTRLIDSVLNRALEIFRQVKLPEKMALTVRLSAEHHFNLGNYNLSEREYWEVMNMYRSLKNNKTSEIYLTLSTLNRYKGNFDKSLLYSLKCLQQTEQGRDTVGLEKLYGELALVYDGLGQLDESINWYKKALDRREISVAPYQNIFVYRTAGFLIRQMIKKGQRKEALALNISLSKKYPPILYEDRSVFAENMAVCYEALKQYATAEKFYLDMIRQTGLMKQYADADELFSIAYANIGAFYVRTGQYARSTYYLNKAWNVQPGTNSLTRQKDLQLMLFTADSATGKYFNAIGHLRQYNMLNDSIFNDKKSNQIEELQIKYETEKKQKEIILLNEQSKMQAHELQRSALIRNFIILGILLLCAFVYYRYYIKQKSNTLLQAQQVEIHHNNKALQSLVNEKEWLLREIHHRVKNNLQVIMALLESQSVYLEDDTHALKAIQDSQHRVHAMSLIHKKLYKSDNVSTMNMLVYIHELVDYLRDSFNTERSILFDIHVDRIELDISQAVPLGLIMNEAITNSIKYAFPGQQDPKISISMKEVGSEKYVLEIADNGIGFPGGINISRPESLGLSLMKGLSEEIDGSFQLESSNGTTIKIAFALNHLIYSVKEELRPAIVS